MPAMVVSFLENIPLDTDVAAAWEAYATKSGNKLDGTTLVNAALRAYLTQSGQALPERVAGLERQVKELCRVVETNTTTICQLVQRSSST